MRKEKAKSASAKPSRRKGTLAKKRQKASTFQPPPLKSSPKWTHTFPIVGLSASAGGLEALETFFSHVPSDCGVAFVVVTHLHPGHVSLLPELIGKCTRMPVMVASDGMHVEPNKIY